VNQWYCQLQGLTSGPFTKEEVKFLALRGKLSQNDRVRKGTEGEWVRADSLKGLFEETPRPAARTPNRVVSPLVTPRMPPVDQPDGQTETLPSNDIRGSIRPTVAAPPRSNRTRNLALLGSGIGTMLILFALLLWLLVRSTDSTSIAGRGQSSEGRMPGGGVGNSGWDEQTSRGGNLAGEDTEASPIAEDEGDASATVETEQDDSGDASQPEDTTGDEGTAEASAPETPAETDPPQEPPPTEEPDPPLAPGMFAIRRLTESEADEGPIAGGRKGMFSHRTAGNRDELVQREGGSPESEEAVNRGLKWLANHQDATGKWSLDQFNRSDGCNGACGGPGPPSDTAGTALALLPFLGAGETHRRGKYKEVVQKGLDWLIKDQQAGGSFQSLGRGTMYAHGQATIALCEALAMTRDKKLRKPAQGAIGYIVKCQHPQGGWRYAPGMAGDTSVLGWQILALRSATTARLRVPKQTLTKADKYLDTAQADKPGGLYGYMPGNPGTPPMSAEGLLCRMYLGWKHDRAGLTVGVDYLLTQLPDPNRVNMYYWYYGTQVLHHYGGDPWKTWNGVMREILIESQETEGHMAGSWIGGGGHDSGGRVYATALALCCLEVYYRHKPIYFE
jgi:uncharacterized protein DUF4339